MRTQQQCHLEQSAAFAEYQAILREQHLTLLRSIWRALDGGDMTVPEIAQEFSTTINFVLRVREKYRSLPSQQTVRRVPSTSACRQITLHRGRRYG